MSVADRTYFIELDGERATHVTVRLKNQPVANAPKFDQKRVGRFAGHLSTSDQTAIEIEHDLRAWQAVLSGYAVVDIDFDTIETSYEAETSEEQAQIHIDKFTLSRSATRKRESEEFGIFGRAFLAIPEGRELITPMHFYREGVQHLFGGRFIDSYNASYLTLETLFCRGRTKTRAAVAELLNHDEVRHAVKHASEAITQGIAKVPPHLPACKSVTDMTLALTQIVELRGRLRHHNRNDPSAWNPARQQEFEHDAKFLGGVVQDIAFRRGAGKVWDEKYTKEFFRMSQELGQLVTLKVRFALKLDEIIRNETIRMNFPGSKPTPKMAQAALQHVLAIIEEKTPGVPIYTIRAEIERTGEELFRYDLGPTLPR